MAQAPTGRGGELAGDWDAAGVEAEWVGIVPGQVPAGIVYALVVEQRFLTMQVFLAMM
jgi:hypothetical protein